MVVVGDERNIAGWFESKLLLQLSQLGVRRAVDHRQRQSDVWSR